MADSADNKEIQLPTEPPKLKSVSQNDTWSEKSTNKIEIDQEMQKAGIGFRSPVISNRINGILNDLSENQRFADNTGDRYRDDILYQVGSVVSILVNYGGSSWDIEYYVCIKNDKPYGTKGIPPLNSTRGLIGLYLEYFMAGAVNSQYWIKLDYNFTKFKNDITADLNNFRTNINNEISQLKGRTVDDGVLGKTIKYTSSGSTIFWEIINPPQKKNYAGYTIELYIGAYMYDNSPPDNGAWVNGMYSTDYRGSLQIPRADNFFDSHPSRTAFSRVPTILSKHPNDDSASNSVDGYKSDGHGGGKISVRAFLVKK